MNKEVQVVEILKSHFERELHDKVTEAILEPVIAKMKVDLEKVVREQVEKVTIGEIHRLCDYMDAFETRLGVSIVWHETHSHKVET